MKYTCVILMVACLVFEVSSRPDQTMQEKAQEMLDEFKTRAHDAVEHAQEAASKAVDAAKVAIHDAVEKAQQAGHEGLEAGREWVEHAKSVAANSSNQTVIEKMDTPKE